jgi:hypothetical protein
VILDPGVVQETGRATDNGTEMGVVLKLPFALDFVSVAVAGKNSLQIRVANLWPNRVIGTPACPQASALRTPTIPATQPVRPCSLQSFWGLPGGRLPAGYQCVP